MTIALANAIKTVADPSASYLSMKPLWDRCRAVCNGERFVKQRDAVLDTVFFSNMLIPFSPTMTDTQYKFYTAEALIHCPKMLLSG